MASPRDPLLARRCVRVEGPVLPHPDSLDAGGSPGSASLKVGCDALGRSPPQHFRPCERAAWADDRPSSVDIRRSVAANPLLAPSGPVYRVRMAASPRIPPPPM